MEQANRRRRITADHKVGRTPGSSGPQTSARLVIGAQSEFGLRGYEGARIADIAATAGVTQSSVYQYFSSKAEIYQAAYAAAQDELVSEFRAAAASSDVFADQIAAIFTASARIYARNPALVPFLASLPLELRRHPSLFPLLAERSTDLGDALNGMFDKARAQGELAGDIRDSDLTIAFMGAVIGVGLMGFGLTEPQIDKPFELLITALTGRLFSAAPESVSTRHNTGAHPAPPDASQD